MNIYSIYKITNTINYRVYIGYTGRNPKTRFKQHKSNNNNKYKTNHPLYRAFRKYGISSFNFEVIYQSKDRNHTLNTMENYFINLYNSHKSGYNQTLGGSGTCGYFLSEEIKDKIRKKSIGRKASLSTRNKMSEQRKGSLNYTYGMKHTEDARRRISEHRSKEYRLFKKNGDIIDIKNLSNFCRNNNYCKRGLTDLLGERRKYHKDIIKIILL